MSVEISTEPTHSSRVDGSDASASLRARRVCFVPHTGIQVDLFARVFRALQEDGCGPVESEVLALGRLVRERAEPMLKRSNWSYRDLTTFGTRDFSAILRILAVNVVVISIENEATITLARAAGVLGIPVVIVQDAFFIWEALEAARKPEIIVRPFTWKERVENKHIQWQRDAYYIETVCAIEKRSRLKEYFNATWAHLVPGQLTGRLRRHGWPPRFGSSGGRLAVMCDFFRDELITQGFSAKQIVVTGQPRFDALVAWREKETRARAYERLLALGLPLVSGRPTIVVATEAFVEYHVWSYLQRDRYLQVLFEAIESLDQPVNLILKLHPQESVEVYRALVGPRWSSCVVRDVESGVVLAAGDLIVTILSTMIVEALMMCRPVVIPEWPSIRIPLWVTNGISNPYVSHGMGHVVNSEGELAAMLGRCLALPSSAAVPLKRAAHFTGPNDGRSAERVAAVIRQLIKG